MLCRPLFGGEGERGPHLTQCRLGRDVQYLRTKCNLNPSSRLATTDMGQKLGAVPLLRRESWVPSYAMWLRAEPYLHAKFHLDPSSRLATIHQRRRRTDRQTGQERQTGETENGLIG